MPKSAKRQVAGELARAAELVEAARKSGDRAFRAMLVRVEKTDAERYRAHILEAINKSTLAARSDGPGGAWREYVFVSMIRNSDWRTSATRRAVAELGRAYSHSEDVRSAASVEAGFSKNDANGVALVMKLAASASPVERRAIGVQLQSRPKAGSLRAAMDSNSRMQRLEGSWSAEAEDLLAAAESAIDSISGGRLVRDSSRRATHKPAGWTKSELIEQAKEYDASISPSTFDRIREAAGIASAERGGRGQQRRFSNAQVTKLIKAASTSRFRSGPEIARAWSGLLGE